MFAQMLHSLPNFLFQKEMRQHTESNHSSHTNLMGTLKPGLFLICGLKRHVHLWANVNPSAYIVCLLKLSHVLFLHLSVVHVIHATHSSLAD